MVAAALLLAAASPLAVLGSGFASEIFIDETSRYVTQTTVIPFIPNASCFVWTVRVAPEPRVVLIDEALELPIAPERWGGIEGVDDSPTTLSPDRRTATTARYVSLIKGSFGNSWCIGEGDPVGKHRITVRHDGKLLKSFDFTVAEPRR